MPHHSAPSFVSFLPLSVEEGEGAGPSAGQLETPTRLYQFQLEVDGEFHLIFWHYVIMINIPWELVTPRCVIFTTGSRAIFLEIFLRRTPLGPSVTHSFSSLPRKGGRDGMARRKKCQTCP